jgi:DNA-binding protein YbaB
VDVDDPPGDIRFDVDEHGRAVALSLSSGWRDRIPTALLGLMLTAELARIAVIEPVVSHPDLWRGPMWASRAAQVQSDLAEIQGELVAQLHRLTEAQDLDELGVTVRSGNGMVGATLLMGRVVRIDVDPAWAQRIAVSEVVDRVTECLEKANAMVDSGQPEAMGGLGSTMSRLQAIGRELGETGSAANGHVW